MIRKYTHRAVTVLAPPDEPGEPLIVSGTVHNADGKPIAGALIYVLVTAAGYRDHRCRSTCQLVFEDDPRMTVEWHKWAKDGGNPVLSVARDQAGIQKCVYGIVLQRN